MKNIFKSITVLLVICLVVSAALAVVNHFTGPVSRANAAAREDNARRQAIPEAEKFEKVTSPALPESVESAYRALDGNENTLGYIFTVTGRGFGGEISVMCAVGMDGTVLRCHTLDVSGETKTLGGQTADSMYTDLYIGQDVSLSGVNSISGATITSSAYEGCVRTGMEAFALIEEAGK